MEGRRGKQPEKYKAHIKSEDFYKHYSAMHFKGFDPKRGRVIIDRTSSFFVDYSQFCKVLDKFNLKLRSEILDNSFDFNMPYRLGLLGIRKKKLTPWFNEAGELINPLPVDWKATLDLWEADPEAKRLKKRVRHYNEHSKGYIGQWYYSTTKATFQWKSAYSFIPCRTAKLLLKDIFKDEDSKVDYYVL